MDANGRKNTMEQRKKFFLSFDKSNIKPIGIVRKAAMVYFKGKCPRSKIPAEINPVPAAITIQLRRVN